MHWIELNPRELSRLKILHAGPIIPHVGIPHTASHVRRWPQPRSMSLFRRPSQPLRPPLPMHRQP